MSLSPISGIAAALLLFSALSVTGADSCTTKGNPIGGAVNDSGYAFEFQSQEGENCRVYRIKNTPGKPLTPVKWSDQDTVFIDTNLPACGPKASCDWITAVQYSLASNRSHTEIGYGINKDQHKTQSPAYVEAKLTAIKFAPQQPFGSVYGSITDLAGNSVPVDFSFRTPRTTTSGQLAFDVLLGKTQTSSSDVPITLKWKRANGTLFSKELTKATSGRVYTVTVDPSFFQGPELYTFEVSQGDKTLLSASAQNYWATNHDAHKE
jgi:hypothetical protein